MEAENVETLLNLIRNYPELYLVGHVDYKNAYKKEVAWRKIQEKTGIDVKTLKAKWRNLRDTYKKYKQGQQTSSGQAAKKLANWQWADQMSFIDSSINLRQTESTLETSRIIPDTSTISIENDNEDVTEAEQIVEPEATESNARHEEISRRRRRVSNNDPADKIINYLKTRKTGTSGTNTAENLVKVACDRIDMEFLGYANTVKKFSLHKQAVIKLQITNIITQAQLQELDNGRPNSNLSNSSSCSTSNLYYIDEDLNMSTPMQSAEQPSYHTEITQIHSPNTQTHSPITQIHTIPPIDNTDSQNVSTIAQIHIPNTPTHSVPTFINRNSQNLLTIAQIHSPNTQIHTIPTIDNTDSQNISTSCAQIHIPSTQTHSVPSFINTNSTIAQIHSPNIQTHSVSTVSNTNTQVPKRQIQRTRQLKNIQEYICNWNVEK